MPTIVIEAPEGVTLRLEHDKNHAGYFFLRTELKEEISEELMEKIAQANKEVTEYQYRSPSQGPAGHQIALRVAAIVGGKAILPPIKPPREGVVF